MHQTTHQTKIGRDCWFLCCRCLMRPRLFMARKGCEREQCHVCLWTWFKWVLIRDGRKTGCLWMWLRWVFTMGDSKTRFLWMWFRRVQICDDSKTFIFKYNSGESWADFIARLVACECEPGESWEGVIARLSACEHDSGESWADMIARLGAC